MVHLGEGMIHEVGTWSQEKICCCMHCHVTTTATGAFNQMPQLAAVVQQVKACIDCTSKLDGWVGYELFVC